MLLTACVVAAVFGFVGSFVAVKVFADDLRGPQGATGIQGAPGEPGARGMDGSDGEPGARGPRGRPGKDAKAATLDLGAGDCAGRPYQVVTDVTAVRGELRVKKSYVCVTH
jgi:hypothetical protein